MRRILHVNASPHHGSSRSLAVAREFLDAATAHRPDVAVDSMDLFRDRLPLMGAEADSYASRGKGGATAEVRRQMRTVFDRFAAADYYLFNIPMWNLGVPYVVKQLIDTVTQPGWSFELDSRHGYTGLLTGRRACVVYTSGIYGPGRGPSFGQDFQSTYFRSWLNLVGITDVTEISLRSTNLGPDPRSAEESAKARARAVALAAADTDALTR
jgi:FMN-dependent NADH-azoreductase